MSSDDNDVSDILRSLDLGEDEEEILQLQKALLMDTDCEDGFKREETQAAILESERSHHDDTACDEVIASQLHESLNGPDGDQASCPTSLVTRMNGDVQIPEGLPDEDKELYVSMVCHMKEHFEASLICLTTICENLSLSCYQDLPELAISVRSDLCAAKDYLDAYGFFCQEQIEWLLADRAHLEAFQTELNSSLEKEMDRLNLNKQLREELKEKVVLKEDQLQCCKDSIVKAEKAVDVAKKSRVAAVGASVATGIVVGIFSLGLGFITGGIGTYNAIKSNNKNVRDCEETLEDTKRDKLEKEEELSRYIVTITQ